MSIFTWILANISTIIVLSIVVAIVAAVIVSLVKSRKKGKLPCGCGCSQCALKDACHSGK